MFSRLALLASLGALQLSGQVPQTPPATAPANNFVKVAIETSEGRITVALDRDHAPATVENFLHYVDTHRYDGQTFYRAMPYDKGGLIQAGITSDAAKLFPPVAHEPTSVTGLHHVRGTLAMARLDPGTARSDFFILTEDMLGFDATATDPGFAAFGHVIEGMEVADKIFHDPVSPTKGAGAMKGQMLDPAIRILRMVRMK